MKRLGLLVLGAAACAGGGAGRATVAAVPPAIRDSAAVPPTADSMGAAVARTARDSAADQAVLDSLHRAPRAKRDSSSAPIPTPAPTPAVPVKGEEVEREAVRLFGELVFPGPMGSFTLSTPSQVAPDPVNRNSPPERRAARTRSPGRNHARAG